MRLIELAYFPPVAWFALAAGEDIICLEACENYRKGTWRNRCLIADANGLRQLSVPLQKGKHHKMPYKEVKIAYSQPWQQVHWRSIASAYGRSPFFAHYADEMRLFFEKKYAFLWDFNLDLLHFAARKIGISTAFEFSEKYLPPEPKSIRDYRDTFSPKNGEIPQWYLPEKYPQVFEDRHGFLPNLSVLDLLMCCGNATLNKLGRVSQPIL